MKNETNMTVKILKTRGPRKGELWSPVQGGGRVIGAVRGTDNNAAGIGAGTNGARMTMTPQKGYGAEMVNNLSKVKRNYNKQVAADKRAAALDRIAERNAAAEAALDNLLADVLG